VQIIKGDYHEKYVLIDFIKCFLKIKRYFKSDNINLLIFQKTNFKLKLLRSH